MVRWTKMSKASQRHLAGIKLNGPFAAAVNLVAETKLPTRKVTELVKANGPVGSRSRSAPSASARRSRAERPAAAPGERPARGSRLEADVALPQVVKLAAVLPLTFVESDPDKRAVAARTVVHSPRSRHRSVGRVA